MNRKKNTFPKDPLPNTIRKLKSVDRIKSFLDILCGKSLSIEDGIFFVIDVFCGEIFLIYNKIK